MTSDAVDTTPESLQQLVIDDALDWRCRGCAVQPMLGQFGLVGGVFLRVSGTRHSFMYVIIDLVHGTISSHCPSCHQWRRLAWQPEQQTMVESVVDTAMPYVGCKCEFEAFAARAREEKNHGR